MTAAETAEASEITLVSENSAPPCSSGLCAAETNACAAPLPSLEPGQRPLCSADQARGASTPDPLSVLEAHAEACRAPALNPRGFQDASALKQYGRLMSRLLTLPLSEALSAAGCEAPSAASVLRVLIRDAAYARQGLKLPEDRDESVESLLALTDRQAAHVLVGSLAAAWAAARVVKGRRAAEQRRLQAAREYAERAARAGQALAREELDALFAPAKTPRFSPALCRRAEAAMFAPPHSQTPLSCVEDGHLVPRDTRWALGLCTTAAAVGAPHDERIAAAFERAATQSGLTGEDWSAAAEIWRRGRPILVIDELTTLSRKLVEDLWSAAPRLAVVFAGPVQKSNPFGWLGVPMAHDPRGELAALLLARTSPTLIEPIAGGMRITMASGILQLRAADPAAAPPWMLSMAQMGAVRRAADRMLLAPEGRIPTEAVDPADPANAPWREALRGADRMPARQRLDFYRRFMTLFSFPTTAFDRSGISEEDRRRLQAHNAAFKADLQNLRAKIAEEIDRLEAMRRNRLREKAALEKRRRGPTADEGRGDSYADGGEGNQSALRRRKP